MVLSVMWRVIGILLLLTGSAYLLSIITAACLGKYGDSKEAVLSSVVIGVFLTVLLVLSSVIGPENWLSETPVKKSVSKQIMLQMDVSQSMAEK